MTQAAEYRIPARITAVDLRQVAGLPDDIPDPFIFETESSNNNLDFYFTHMLESTLRNFAAEAAVGVQFLDSHKSYNLGYGRTFEGRFEIDSSQQPRYRLDNPNAQLAFQPDTAVMRAVIGTYTVPGIQFGGGLTYASTDDFIRAARAKLARDISVGFYGGRWTCDICGGNYRSYQSCQHLAGFEYALGDQGERIVVCTVGIDGAHLAEHSVVYDGATPGAMLRKAEELARHGELEPEKAAAFELRYKVNLPTRKSFPVADLEDKPVNVPNENTAGRGKELPAPESTGDQPMNYEEIVNEARTALAEANVNESVPVAGGIRQLHQTAVNLQAQLDAVRTAVPETAVGSDMAGRVAWLAAELTRLTPLADDGRAYRADLIEEAIGEGVRAMGPEFAQEAYRGLLSVSTIEVIKRMRDDWRAIAAKTLAGGRSTVDGDENQQDSKAKKNGRSVSATTAALPAAAHKA
jgi:hypothetical protein